MNSEIAMYMAQVLNTGAFYCSGGVVRGAATTKPQPRQSPDGIDCRPFGTNPVSPGLLLARGGHENGQCCS
jgi:hypothetical protein